MHKELHRAAAEADLDGVVPHMLRHTYATALVKRHTGWRPPLMGARARVRGDEPALRQAVRRDRPRRVPARYAPWPKPSSARCLPLSRTPSSRSPPSPAGTGAARRSDRSPAGGRVLPARCRPGRARQHLRALPELPQRRQLPARAAVPARRHAEALAADAEARGWGEEGRPPPPPHRTTRPADRPGQCRLTTGPHPRRGRLRRARRDRAAHHVHRSRSIRADQPHHPLPAGRPARRHRRPRDPRPGRQHPDRPGRPDRGRATPQPRSRRRQGPPPRGNHPPARARTPIRAVSSRHPRTASYKRMS